MRTEASIRGRHPSEAKLMAIREYRNTIDRSKHNNIFIFINCIQILQKIHKNSSPVTVEINYRAVLCSLQGMRRFNFLRHIDLICIILSARYCSSACSHIMSSYQRECGHWTVVSGHHQRPLIWKSGHSRDHAILILSLPPAHLEIVEIGQYLD